MLRLLGMYSYPPKTLEYRPSIGVAAFRIPHENSVAAKSDFFMVSLLLLFLPWTVLTAIKLSICCHSRKSGNPFLNWHHDCLEIDPHFCGNDILFLNLMAVRPCQKRIYSSYRVRIFLQDKARVNFCRNMEKKSDVIFLHLIFFIWSIL